jgi:hypothetical protein
MEAKQLDDSIGDTLVSIGRPNGPVQGYQPGAKGKFLW